MSLLTRRKKGLKRKAVAEEEEHVQQEYRERRRRMEGEVIPEKERLFCKRGERKRRQKGAGSVRYFCKAA